MYYIVNQTEHIIATDSSLLKLLSVENIDELYRKIALGDIKFTTSDEKITITTKNRTRSYQTENHILSGILGDMTLVYIHPYKEEISAINDGILSLSDHKQEEIQDESEEVKSETEELEDNNSPIVIDIESISKEIGISTNDYKNFLNEYIDTALSLEEDLKNAQEGKRTHAISTLSHLSNILHLPVITNIITQIENSKLDEQDLFIRSLYATLARLTTSQIDTFKDDIQLPVENSVDEVEKDITAESFGTIDLDDVTPIAFDFQIEAAANDLSLPVGLIEEFIYDFIAQSHTETEKMLDAYEKGDLNTIQNIGHLLKGSASNLRIDLLSDTLYKIQFCEESSNLENLIKDYWGHFLSFENQIDLRSKMKGE